MGCRSGLTERSWKPSHPKGCREFESHPHRQFSEFGFWAIVASPRQRRGSASARILNGFLKSKNNFCPLKRKFEPIFFRKSRPCSGFSCKAIISACFTEFMNLAASSNRLLLFCSKVVSLSFKNCFWLTSLFLASRYSARFKALVLKTSERKFREFESHLLRQ